MKIRNKTKWSTKDLNSFFMLVLRDNNRRYNNKIKGQQMRVTVAYSQGNYSGYAYYNSHRMRLKLPKPDRCNNKLDPGKLAFLFEHELQHCRGIKHREMPWYCNWENAKVENFPYLSDQNVGLQGDKIKPVIDQQIQRYEKAMTLLTKWLQRQKGVAKKVKAYAGQVKRYEKIFAADGRLAALKGKKDA